MIYTSHSPSETEELGAKTVSRMNKKKLIGMHGDLGAGKTVFIKGIAKALGYTGDVTSPTFALVNEYLVNRKPVLIHFDLYRTDSDGLEDLGWYDYLGSDCIVVAEWAENAPDEFADAVNVTITGSGDDVRSIEITGLEE